MQDWNEAWNALPQGAINGWMENMPALLQNVIDHEEDNDFYF